MVLPKFKLTIMQVSQQLVSESKRGAEQSGAQTAGGADRGDRVTVSEEGGHGQLAYVLHTSGTTGFPKTVRVPHRCILPNILHLR